MLSVQYERLVAARDKHEGDWKAIAKEVGGGVTVEQCVGKWYNEIRLRKAAGKPLPQSHLSKTQSRAAASTDSSAHEEDAESQTERLRSSPMVWTDEKVKCL